MRDNVVQQAHALSCALVLLLPFCALSQSDHASRQLPVRRSVSEVFSLSKTEAARAYPVALDAVVLYSDPVWGGLFVQDATGATYIDVHGTTKKYPEGALIHISAVTTANESGPAIAQPKIDILGRGVLPKPKPKTVAELDAGEAESSRVVTEGVLHPCERDYDRICFRVHDRRKVIWIFIPQTDSPSVQSLVGATVRVTGVAARHVDENYKRIAAEIHVNSLKDIQVETPSSGGFSSAPLPIHELRSSEADERFAGPMHLRGVVIWQSPGLFYLQDTSGSVFVETWKEFVVHVGDTVDAVGFSAPGAFGPELSDSLVRIDSAQPKSAVIAPLPLNSAAEAVKRSLHGKLVRFKARLIDQSASDTEIVYQLESEGQRFNAVLPRSEVTRAVVGLTRDSVLEVKGIALIQGGSPEWPESLMILVASPADMEVLKDTGWLTLKTGLAILFGAGICVLFAIIWITQLKRTTRKQTEIIRARLESEARLENRFRRLFERNQAAVYTWQPDGRITECNQAFVNMLGLSSREELIGRSYWDLEVDEARRAQLKDSLGEEPLSNCDASLLRSDGAIVRLLENITPVPTPEGVVYETTAIDVTLLRENQAELQKARDAAVHEALNDPLTGLPNRRCLMEKISSMVSRTRRKENLFALLYIDLDGFKQVNDSLGHQVGDALLVQMASCLRSWIREGDLLARLGGDEFLVILDRLYSREDAALVATNLLKSISHPFQVKGHELTIGASIGISIYPDDSVDAEQLLQQADSAMYAAKREGKNRFIQYTPEIGFLVHERLTLENLLRGAVARDEISLVFQPEFDLISGRLVRFEALARWMHPAIGPIPPNKFIPIAEESGMIASLGSFILEQACREALRWQKLTGYPIPVAVNVSGIQLRNKDFVEDVSEILQCVGLNPQLLQMELTESAMLIAADCSTKTMIRLQSMGISMAIDDFGTGYSNMSYLPSLPFDALKIDRSFVANLGLKPESESILRTIVDLARNMGMRVIVEGVETEQQLEIVKALGADEVQGYLLGRPAANPLDFLSPFVNATSENGPKPFITAD
ncbi:MAG: EAL domain-containing protein [Terracidiphilus sp.]